MTQSNLDIARECGACNPPNEPRDCLLFSPFELDAFADRIRADAQLSGNSGQLPPVALPAVERKPLTFREIASATSKQAHIRSDYAIEIARAIESAHGIS